MQSDIGTPLSDWSVDRKTLNAMCNAYKYQGGIDEK